MTKTLDPPVNLMDYWLSADGSPVVNGLRTHNISKAIVRAKDDGARTLFLPPAKDYGIEAYTCDPVPEGLEMVLENLVPQTIQRPTSAKEPGGSDT